MSEKISFKLYQIIFSTHRFLDHSNDPETANSHHYSTNKLTRKLQSLILNKKSSTLSRSDNNYDINWISDAFTRLTILTPPTTVNNDQEKTSIFDFNSNKMLFLQYFQYILSLFKSFHTFKHKLEQNADTNHIQQFTNILVNDFFYLYSNYYEDLVTDQHQLSFNENSSTINDKYLINQINFYILFTIDIILTNFPTSIQLPKNSELIAQLHNIIENNRCVEKVNQANSLFNYNSIQFGNLLIICKLLIKFINKNQTSSVDNESSGHFRNSALSQQTFITFLKVKIVYFVIYFDF
jgi:hypothetical protein